MDESKVQAKLNQLAGETGHVWKTADGYHAMTAVDLRTSGAVFNPGSGIPVKVFVDTVTGELKMFPASMFE